MYIIICTFAPLIRNRKLNIDLCQHTEIISEHWFIKRIPGAEVDEEGVITINGKEVKKIMVDGKEFMLGDVETALKNIPVSIIQNLKFYDQQSDQARITGIEDGEKETVLDFSIKKGMKRGYMTNLDLGGGTKHRYASPTPSTDTK